MGKLRDAGRSSSIAGSDIHMTWKAGEIWYVRISQGLVNTLSSQCDTKTEGHICGRFECELL